MATLSCLLAGLYTFQQGQARAPRPSGFARGRAPSRSPPQAALSQKMMRARVVAQGATVVVLAVGTLAASKVKNPEDERPKGMHPIEYEAMKAEQGK